jgi:N-acetylglucosaminyldiphosphoundecaprenol N-acetyl-beta-D-mannosaminyltransferase
MENQRHNILGVYVSATNLESSITAIDDWMSRKEPHYVCVTSVHGIIESQTDKNLRQIHNQAGLVTPDGMPLVWLIRLNGFQNVERVYGPDLMLALCKHSIHKGYRHFFYGGEPGIPEKLGSNLKKRLPGLEIVGTYSPPFRPLTAEEDQKIVEMINAQKPDIVWVGLSTPKQEKWMAEHIGRVSASTLIGVGAAFDYLSNNKKQAPQWIRHTGFEWFYRLLVEPRRLWRRYIKIVPLFIVLLIGQKLDLIKYEESENHSMDKSIPKDRNNELDLQR